MGKQTNERIKRMLCIFTVGFSVLIVTVEAVSVLSGGAPGGSAGARGGSSGSASSGNAYGGVSGDNIVPSTGRVIPSDSRFECDRWEYPPNCGNSDLPCNVMVCRHWS